MGFKINLPPHKRAAGRFIGQVRRDLIKVVEEAAFKYGKTRASMARNIGCDKAVITRKLSGKSDLTLRSISEIAYEANVRPRIVFEKAHILEEGSNMTTSYTSNNIYAEDDVYHDHEVNRMVVSRPRMEVA